MKSKLRLVLIAAFCVFLLDQVTKALIVAYLPQGGLVTVLPGIFDIVHGRNTGAAFGMLHGWNSTLKNGVFYAIGIVALIFLFHYLKTLADKEKWSIAALGLILGGALGNITDRLFRGSVVDFLSLHYHDKIWTGQALGYRWSIPLYWPSFNVADSAICVAVAILVIQNLKCSKKS
jgi:signal peptidase II